MKKILLIILLSFVISSNSYSQFLGKNVFKNEEELDLDKILKLDISKYKITDVKKLFGENYFTENEFLNLKGGTWYYIFLKKDNNKYKLTLGNNNDTASLFLDLVASSDIKNKKSYFKNCSEIKDKYSKQFGKSFRFNKEKESHEYLLFQINYSNHLIEVNCLSWDNVIDLNLLISKSKKNSRVMEEVSKITCTFNKQRIEHLWSGASNNSYMKIEDLVKKETLNLFIDEYSKTIGRVLEYNWEIRGEYKVFSKDKIQVIENRGKESTITWNLNRINGDIETYTENSNSSVSHLIADRKAKSTKYGNCQKTKGNVL
jgi:hypothetical protein